MTTPTEEDELFTLLQKVSGNAYVRGILKLGDKTQEEVIMTGCPDEMEDLSNRKRRDKTPKKPKVNVAFKEGYDMGYRHAKTEEPKTLSNKILEGGTFEDCVEVPDIKQTLKAVEYWAHIDLAENKLTIDYSRFKQLFGSGLLP